MNFNLSHCLISWIIRRTLNKYICSKYIFPCLMPWHLSQQQLAQRQLAQWQLTQFHLSQYNSCLNMTVVSIPSVPIQELSQFHLSQYNNWLKYHLSQYNRCLKFYLSLHDSFLAGDSCTITHAAPVLFYGPVLSHCDGGQWLHWWEKLCGLGDFTSWNLL